MLTLNYRADIDGLRALAILFVMIFHGGLSFLKSGFIGVDIFFVISGFLITSIINDSLENNQFSLSKFYSRRLWRLQPVFICLLLITTILALIFYLPDDLMDFSRSARKTSLFISNIYFKSITTNYFAPDTHHLPLLHTWSLSIEWQCYLILPVFCYVLKRIFKHNFNMVIYLLTILFFILSIYESYNYPAQTYYFLNSRIFEFLIGASVSLYHFKHFTFNKTLLNILGILAIITLFYVATKDNIVLGYPNYYALSVCVATGVIIHLGKNNSNNYVTRFLSLKPLVFIGLLSYSLYVWHWVILAVFKYQGISETTLNYLFTYSLIFIVSYGSWRFIEKPSRTFSTIPFKYTFVSLILLPIIFVHLNSYVIKTNQGFPARFDQELVNVYQKLEQNQFVERPKCIDKSVDDPNSYCHIGAENDIGNKKALMIGDSFANHYWGFMDVLGKDANLSILMTGTSSCITLPGIYLYNWWHFKNQVYAKCHDATIEYYEMIKANHYDYVIIGQNWPNYIGDNVIKTLNDKRSLSFTKKRLKFALDEALQIISESGAKPVLIKHSATAAFIPNARDCFFKHIKLRQKYNPRQCDFDLQVLETEKWLDNLFKQMQDKYPALVIIDPKKVQCPNNRCKAAIKGVPIYRDIGHITDYASLQLGNLYLKNYNNPLGNSEL